jgi:hypothetical protein
MAAHAYPITDLRDRQERVANRLWTASVSRPVGRRPIQDSGHAKIGSAKRPLDSCGRLGRHARFQNI